jgi:hypothetical protein
MKALKKKLKQVFTNFADRPFGRQIGRAVLIESTEVFIGNEQLREMSVIESKLRILRAGGRS